MTEAIKERLADLKKKLAARKGKPAYAGNIQAIQAEIDRIEEALRIASL
jgi:hypothetical protein